MWFFKPIETENKEKDTWFSKTTVKTTKKESKKIDNLILVYDVNKPSMLFVSTIVNMGLLGYGIDYNDVIRMEKPEHNSKNGTYMVMNSDGSFKDTERYKWTVTEDYPWLNEWKSENTPAEVKAEPDK